MQDDAEVPGEEEDRRSLLSEATRASAFGSPVHSCPWTIFYSAEGSYAQLLQLSFRSNEVKKAVGLPPNPARDWQIRSASNGHYIYSHALQTTQWVPRSDFSVQVWRRVVKSCGQ